MKERPQRVGCIVSYHQSYQMPYYLFLVFALSGSADKTVKFWDLESFELIGSAGPEVCCSHLHWDLLFDLRCISHVSWQLYALLI